VNRQYAPARQLSFCPFLELGCILLTGKTALEDTVSFLLLYVGDKVFIEGCAPALLPPDTFNKGVDQIGIKLGSATLGQLREGILQDHCRPVDPG